MSVCRFEVLEHDRDDGNFTGYEQHDNDVMTMVNIVVSGVPHALLVAKDFARVRHNESVVPVRHWRFQLVGKPRYQYHMTVC